MFSLILGWLLVALGIVSYVAALVILFRSQSVRLPETDTSKEANLALVCDLLDKIAKVLENFARLTVPVQWAILGLLNIGIGAYLIANRPF
jgi:hypothetical protein